MLKVCYSDFANLSKNEFFSIVSVWNKFHCRAVKVVCTLLGMSANHSGRE